MTAAQQLADARRKLGLSLADISSRTKISVERLSAIERADAAGLPAFVYLKGFLRAYAAEVTLDPDAVSDRYISELAEPSALVSLEHSLGGSIVPAAADAFAEFESEDDRADDTLPPNSSGVAVVRLERQTRSAEMNPPGAPAPAVVGATHAQLTTPTNYRKSFPLVPLVLASTLAMAGGYLLGAKLGPGAPHHASDSNSVSASGPSAGPAPTASPSAHTTEPRTLDADSAPAPPARPARASERPRKRPDARSQTSAPSNRRHTSISDAPGRPSAERQSAPAINQGAVVDAAPPSAAAPAAEPPTLVARGGSPKNADNVSGGWNVTSKVESATFAAYKELMVGFRLELEQRGDQVVGEGYKISENGAPLPARRRTPITVEGTLEGNRLALNFTEVGARRRSAGRFVLYLAEDASYRGRFTSDAAQSSGVTVAVREPSSGRH